MNDTISHLRHRHIVSAKGTTLAHFSVPHRGTRRGAAFVAHGQAHHSLNMRDTLEGLADRGWDVHAADLRGHGASSGLRAPLAHMDVDVGWELLVEDLRTALLAAFEGVPRAERLVVAPNLGAVLLLEVMKDWPNLAPRIVLVAPPSNQLALTRLARGFIRARLLLRAADAPDELTVHQLYSFLGAQLQDRPRLIDVVSGDRRVTEALEADPLAWPIPTTGYFYEFFRGIEAAWRWPKGKQVASDTRVLVLYGSEDGVTSNGQFIEPMRRQLLDLGFAAMETERVEGGRAGLILDEATLGISGTIDDWANETVSATRTVASANQAEPLVRNALEWTDPALADRDLDPDELVELCYHAVDDERRWVELMNRIAHAAVDDERLGEGELQSIMAALMPHWERSFRLNRQIMRSAAIGAVLENVIERFNIGVAVVTADLQVLQSNELFRVGLAELTGDTGTDTEPSALVELADEGFRSRSKSRDGEAVLIVRGEAVGFHFRPAALRQTALQRDGASGVLVLRPTNSREVAADSSIDILQLAYGLTAAEAKATLALLDGCAPAGIAERLGITIHTTRTHLRRIYEKVGVQGQTELAARLLGGPLGLVLGR